MRKAIVFFALLCAPLTVGAQQADSATTSEVQVAYQGLSRAGKLSNRATLQWYETWGPLGWWGYGYAESKYLSTTVGLYKDFWNYFSFGLAAGMEEFAGEGGQNTFFGRGAATLYIGTEKTFVEFYSENGASKSRWDRVDAQLWESHRLSLGGIYQTGDGFGPRIRFSIPLWRNESTGKGGHFRLWVAPMYKNLSSLRKPQGLLFGGEIVGSLRQPTSP